MMRPKQLGAACAIALIAFCGLLPGALLARGSQNKNIILITLDGLRADHLSCYGYERKTSPHIDLLAEKGMIFRQIITSGCSTKMALTSLFTSLDYRFHKIIEHDSMLDEKFLTLAEVLHERGYETFGVVGTPMLQRAFNYHQGFDVFEEFRDEAKGQRFISAELAATRILSWLARRGKQKPFFVYCHMEETHPPWKWGSPWLEGVEPSSSFFDAGCSYLPSAEEKRRVSAGKKRNLIAKYDGAILHVDAQIARIVAGLAEMGLTKNTVIAVSADHGYELLDHGTATHGYCPYDEVVRIPLVIRVGGGARPARSFNRLGRIIDIGPTLLHLAGVAPSPLWQGRSLLMSGRDIPVYAFAVGYNLRLVRTARFKLIYQDIQSVRKSYWKSPGDEFYDLAADPEETRNLTPAQTPEFKLMKEELSRFWDDLLHREFLPGTAIPKKARMDTDTIKILKSLGYID